MLGALGKREVYERGANRSLSDYERKTIRRQSLSIAVRATLIAVIAAAIAWVV